MLIRLHDWRKSRQRRIFQRLTIIFRRYRGEQHLLSRILCLHNVLVNVCYVFGSGALLYETTAYSSVWGAAAMAAVCFLVISFDLSGVVTLNLVLVPLMIFGICGVCVYSGGIR